MSSDAASRRIGAFVQRFGPAYLALACHAAFPLALTPDLLYRLWAHFQLDTQGAPLRVPWVAVADLLLSGMCREVGHELYELEPAVRAALLRELRDSPRFGQARIAELGRFLLDYVGQLLLSDSPDERDFAEAQQWTPLAYVRPDEALRRLAQAARAAGSSHAEHVRLRALIEALEAPLGEHAEFAQLLAGVRADAKPAQPARGTPRRKASTTPPPAKRLPEQQAEDPADIDRQIEQLQAELEKLRSRLSFLEREQAQRPVDIEPHTVLFLADTQEEIKQVEAKLALAQREQLRRQLHERERQQAIYGINTPTDVLLDIQDLKSKLAAIEDQGARGTPPNAEPVPANKHTRDLLTQRDQLRRRLRALELQQAYYGFNAPAELVVELHETQRALEAKNAQLAAFDNAFADNPDVLDQATLEHTQQVGLTKLRRLRIREEQKAALGDQAEPIIDNELAELRTEISQIERQLGNAGVPLAEPVAPTITPPRPLGDAERAQLDELRHTTLRRLREREKQRATFGDNSVAPEILMEIEDLQARLRDLDSQLGGAPPPDAEALAHTQEIRRIKLRRLDQIELMSTTAGSQIPPYLLREREHLQTEIAQLDQQQRDAGVTPSDLDTTQTPPPAPKQSAALAPDAEERAPLEARYHMIQRRLKIRERQQALLGYDTPPEVSTEIEDLRGQLADLAAQLGGTPPAPAPRQPPELASPEQRPLIEAQRERVAERLRPLEEQRARYGEARVPPEIVIVIEDLRAEIADLDGRLGIVPEAPAGNEPGQRVALEQQRANQAERLRVLEEQAARYGADTAPATLQVEIEDVRNQIADLDRALSVTQQAPAETSWRITASATTRWGNLQLSGELTGLSTGELPQTNQKYLLYLRLQLTPTEIAQAFSQSSQEEQKLTLDLTVKGDNTLQVETPASASQKSKDNQAQQPVQLSSGEQSKLVLFGIQPTRAGQAALVISASAEGTLLLTQRLSFTVEDAPVEEQQVSPSVDASVAPADPNADGLALASTTQRPAELNTVVIRADTGLGYAIVGADGQELFRFPSTEPIAYSAASMTAIAKVVNLQDRGGGYAYQGDSTQVGKTILAQSLEILTERARQLAADIFLGRQAARTVNAILRSQAGSGQLRIQVADKQYLIPWQWLIDDELEEADPLRFWGMRHQIEYRSMDTEPGRAGFDPEIAIGDFEELELAFVHAGDRDLRLGSIIAGERERLRGLRGVRVREYSTTRELAELLGNPGSPAQIIYFLTTVGVQPDSSSAEQVRFGLRDANITLDELAQLVGDSPPLKSAPLVLLSTPHSLNMRPAVYTLLTPFFLSRGARGVLGSDYDVPPFFAAEFMRELITRFVAGDQPLGGLLLELRRAYALQRNNLLGLLYSLYGSDDPVVRHRGSEIYVPPSDPSTARDTMVTQPPPLL